MMKIWQQRFVDLNEWKIYNHKLGHDLRQDRCHLVYWWVEKKRRNIIFWYLWNGNRLLHNWVEEVLGFSSNRPASKCESLDPCVIFVIYPSSTPIYGRVWGQVSNQLVPANSYRLLPANLKQKLQLHTSNYWGVVAFEGGRCPVFTIHHRGGWGVAQILPILGRGIQILPILGVGPRFCE